jgi:hypothetical protein
MKPSRESRSVTAPELPEVALRQLKKAFNCGSSLHDRHCLGWSRANCAAMPIPVDQRPKPGSLGGPDLEPDGVLTSSLLHDFSRRQIIYL